MSAGAWTELLKPQAEARPARRSLASVWEEALTFSLVLIALLSVVISVERANWVNEMPSLGVAAVVGLLSGWLLARSRAPGWALHLAGIPIGIPLSTRPPCSLTGLVAKSGPGTVLSLQCR